MVIPTPTQIMSEVPFLFFSVLALCLLSVYTELAPDARRGRLLLGLIGASLAALYLRSIGITLVAAVLLALLARHDLRGALIYAGGSFLGYAPWLLRNLVHGTHGYLSQLLLQDPYLPQLGHASLSALFERPAVNVPAYLFEWFPFMLWPETLLGADQILPALLGAANLAVLVLFGVLEIRRRRMAPLLYLVFSFAVIAFWPPVWIDTRYLLPLLPVVGLAYAQVFEWIGARLRRARRPRLRTALGALAALGLLAFSASHVHQARGSVALGYHLPAYPPLYRLCEWTRRNLPADAVISVRKPFQCYLLAGRRTTQIMAQDSAKFLQALQSQKVTHHLAARLGMTQEGTYYSVMQAYPSHFTLIRRVPEANLNLYQFHP